jgi:hypothetical protein
VVAAVVVLHTDPFARARVLLEFHPDGLGDPAAGVAKAPAVNEELLVGVEHGPLLAVLALEGLNHASGGHPGKEAEPAEEHLALERLRGVFRALEAHDVPGPCGKVRALGPAVTDDQGA